MNEQPKTVEEAALAEYPIVIDSIFHNKPTDINLGRRVGFVKGAHWQQSDPAFISDIVRQTLEYVANEPIILWERMKCNNIISVGPVVASVDKDGILAMHPQITDNIIKKK